MNLHPPREKACEAAIVGSGPSAFFTAEALLRKVPGIRVHLFERLPVPYGLIRFGVAPDRPKIKSVTRKFAAVAGNDRVRFHGNVDVGVDLGVEDLLEHFHAVILACGTPCPRDLGIPGEDLPGSYSAAELTGWYNGHPDYAGLAPDLGGSAAVVVGQGNVALDVARMLACDPAGLRGTDIAGPALRSLASGSIATIHVVGRRGPGQASFSIEELEALAELDGCRLELAPDRTAGDGTGSQEVAERLAELAGRPLQRVSRRIRFHFCRLPVRITGRDRVTGIELEESRLTGPPDRRVAVPTGRIDRIACGLVVRCIGYRGAPPPGVPFDEDAGIVPNREGRVVAHPGGRLYVAGWIKSGPRGSIGTARRDAAETVRAVKKDLDEPEGPEPPGAAELLARLHARGVRAVSYEQWLCIDVAERERGRTLGKPREKILNVDEMLSVAGWELGGPEPGTAG